MSETPAYATSDEDGTTKRFGEPTVDDRTFTLWGIKNGDRGVILFGENRKDAEYRLGQQAGKLPDAVLISRQVRTRTERWEAPIEVVPWHTPCSWVNSVEGAAAGDPDYCTRHKHLAGDPVPSEFIRDGS